MFLSMVGKRLSLDSQNVCLKDALLNSACCPWMGKNNPMNLWNEWWETWDGITSLSLAGSKCYPKWLGRGGKSQAWSALGREAGGLCWPQGCLRWPQGREGEELPCGITWGQQGRKEPQGPLLSHTHIIFINAGSGVEEVTNPQGLLSLLMPRSCVSACWSLDHGHFHL